MVAIDYPKIFQFILLLVDCEGIHFYTFKKIIKNSNHENNFFIFRIIWPFEFYN